MKKLTAVATIAMLALTTPLFAADVKQTTPDRQQQASSKRSDSAEDLKGLKVFSQTGEELGKITKVMVDQPSGTINFVIITRGVGQGMGDSESAIPLEAFTLDKENRRATLSVDTAKLDNAPLQTNKSNHEFQRELSSYYGVASASEKRQKPQIDQPQSRVPDPSPALETGSPQKRDPLNQLD